MTDPRKTEPDRSTLIINDDTIQRSIYRLWMEEEGYRVVEADDGLQAIELLKTWKGELPELIISDLYMPRIDGWKLCRMLRADAYRQFREIPILVVSATYAEDQVQHLVMQAGAEGFLQSPVKRYRFMETVRTLRTRQKAPDRERVLLVSTNTHLRNWFDLAFGEDPAISIEKATSMPDHLVDGGGDTFDLLIIDGTYGEALLPAPGSKELPVHILIRDEDDCRDLADHYSAGFSAVLERPLGEERVRTTIINTLRERRLFNIEHLLADRSSSIIKQNQFLGTILDSVQTGLIIYNPDLTIQRVNTFLKQTFPAATAISGRPCHEVLKGRKNPCPRCTVLEAFETGRVINSSEFNLVNRRWYRSATIPIFDETGEVKQVLETMHDITEEKESREIVEQALQEKTLLVKEIHHRVKNNLQIISSLLHLQASTSDDPALEMLLQESQNRIATMALLHEELYKNENYTHVEMRSYLNRILAGMADTREFRLLSPEGIVSLEKAVPLGLIVNELATNALKYSIEDSEGVRMRLIITSREDEAGSPLLHMEMRNLCGQPEGEKPVRDEQHHLGLSLIEGLSQQLGGTFSITFQENDTLEAAGSFVEAAPQMGPDTPANSPVGASIPEKPSSSADPASPKEALPEQAVLGRTSPGQDAPSPAIALARITIPGLPEAAPSLDLS